jgi:hypothetical protein
LQPGHDALGYLARVAAILCVACVWVLVQRQALTGGLFAPYLRSLPLTLRHRLLVDAAVLLPANTVLLVPVAATLLAAPGQAGSVNGLWLIKLGALLALVLSAQLAALAWRHALGVRWRIGWRWRMPLVWRIQCKALATLASGVRAAALLLVVLGANVLMAAFGFDGCALPTAALALAALALISAGWYRSLHDAHAGMAAYLRALPLPRNFWRWRDMRFILGAGIASALTVLGPLLVRVPRQFAAAVLLLAAYAGLLAALRLPVLRGGRQAAMWAVLMAAAWSTAAVAATA